MFEILLADSSELRDYSSTQACSLKISENLAATGLGCSSFFASEVSSGLWYRSLWAAGFL